MNDLLTKRNRVLACYQDYDLKVRRTHQNLDSKRFILQSWIDFKQGPITEKDFSSYIDTLIEHCPYQFLDLSTPSEQFLLIECSQTIGMTSSFVCSKF